MRAALDRGGRAIVSGILLSERDAMVDSFASDGWRVLDEDVDGEWWSTVLTPA